MARPESVALTNGSPHLRGISTHHEKTMMNGHSAVVVVRCTGCGQIKIGMEHKHDHKCDSLNFLLLSLYCRGIAAFVGLTPFGPCRRPLSRLLAYIFPCDCYAVTACRIVRSKYAVDLLRLKNGGTLKLASYRSSSCSTQGDLSGIRGRSRLHDWTLDHRRGKTSSIRPAVRGGETRQPRGIQQLKHHAALIAQVESAR